MWPRDCDWIATTGDSDEGYFVVRNSSGKTIETSYYYLTAVMKKGECVVFGAFTYSSECLEIIRCDQIEDDECIGPSFDECNYFSEREVHNVDVDSGSF